MPLIPIDSAVVLPEIAQFHAVFPEKRDSFLLVSAEIE
jgi:hypothetical protein